VCSHTPRYLDHPAVGERPESRDEVAPMALREVACRGEVLIPVALRQRRWWATIRPGSFEIGLGGLGSLVQICLETGWDFLVSKLLAKHGSQAEG